MESGLKDTGKGGLKTLSGGLDVVTKGVDDVVATGVKTSTTVTGETLQKVGAKKVGKFLESDKVQKGATLAANIALLAVPGVGEEELAAEAAEATKLAGSVDEAASAAKESEVALEEAKSATKAAEEAKSAATTEEEATAADKELKEAKDAEEEAQATHDENVDNVKKAESERDAQVKTKFAKTRQALRSKYVRMGLKGAALSDAVNIAIEEYVAKGKPPPDTPPKKKEDVKGSNMYLWIILLVLLVIGIIVLML